MNDRRLIFLALVIALSLNSFRFSSYFGDGDSKGSLVDRTSITKIGAIEQKTSHGNISAPASTAAHAYSLTTLGNITWTGNRWNPPMDLPYLVPKTIRNIFRSENTLWLGDSTARQDYQTMYELIQLDGTNDNTITLDLPREALDRLYILNRGKRKRVNDFRCPVRSDPEEIFQDLGQVKGTDQNCSTPTAMDEDGPWKNFALDDQMGKFDVMRSDCFGHILSNIQKYRKEVGYEYNVLVVSSGIHEVVRPTFCRRVNETVSNETTWKHQEELLDFLLELSGPSMFVVWKAHGPASSQSIMQGRTEQLLVNRTRDWFLEKQPKYMDLADFNLAIQERSYGPNRIVGDLKPHWGLEARLLSIELISDILRRKQERQRASS